MNTNEVRISADQTVQDAINILERMGFSEYRLNTFGDAPAGFEADFDQYAGTNAIVMLENEIARNMICVVLHEAVGMWTYTVYVQIDIACGWVEMPFRWSEVNECVIAALKLAFTGQIIGKLIP